MDRHRFDAEPDPSFHFDADADPYPSVSGPGSYTKLYPCTRYVRTVTRWLTSQCAMFEVTKTYLLKSVSNTNTRKSPSFCNNSLLDIGGSVLPVGICLFMLLLNIFNNILVQ